MKITDLAIERSTTVYVLLLLIFISGIYAYAALPREENPEVIIPFISVTTRYEGVAPADMETLITLPIERKMTGLDDVKEITSSTSEGVSSIVIEFETNTDIDDALQKVRDKVSQAKNDLPQEADDPDISEINLAESPIMYLSLTGPVAGASLPRSSGASEPRSSGSATSETGKMPALQDGPVAGASLPRSSGDSEPRTSGAPPSDTGKMPALQAGPVGRALLSNFAKELEEDIEAIRGVLDVEVVGGTEREIQIVVDPDLSGEYGVSLTDLVQLARVENLNIPAGSVELGDGKYLVRVPGEFRSAEEIEGLVVKAGSEGIVYVRDIARIVDGFKDIESLSRLNGEEAVTLTVAKRSGENIIAIADAVRSAGELFKSRLMPGMTLHITMDESTQIRQMVADLENNILSGLILVLLVIFVFLGFTNALFVSLAIPISMLMTFTFLYLTGTTLNMVVLFSLMLALGMLVDNGIVIVENIHRHGQLGLAPKEAAKTGAAEVAWPITGSTLTTIAAFSPMFFWPGIWGKFMVYLPMTLVFALGASLFVGLVVNPALASRLMRTRRAAATPSGKRAHWLLRGYASLLGGALRWRAVTLTLFVTWLVVISVVFFASSTVEFTPETEPRSTSINVDGPQGLRLSVTNRIVEQVEGEVAEFKDDVEFVIANVGTRGVSRMGFRAGGGVSHIGRVNLDFPPLAEAPTKPSLIVAQLRNYFKKITGAEITLEQEEMGPGSEPPINVEISGEEFPVLSELATEIRTILEKLPDVVDIRDDYEKGQPEIRVITDRQQALLTGLNTQFIGEVVKTAVSSRDAGKYREGDEEYDVVVRFPESFRQDLSRVESMNLVNLNGQAIPFSSVARLEHGAGLGTITRIDRRRTVTVSADVQNRSGPEVLRDVQAVLSSFPLPPGYTLEFTGENEDMQETESFLLKAFVVALLLIALVLITQFNSILQPFIIMSSVILSLAGVFLGLYIFQMPFGILMTGIGCISLAGVVVNNAIVLIDFINQLRAEGWALREAIIEASTTRFRPVMLTAITTILGLIPMAAGVSFDFRQFQWTVGSDSSQWWGSLAIAVIFGLGFATLLTLIVVPVLYSLTAKLEQVIAKTSDATDA